MNDALLMNVVHGPGDHLQQPGRFLGRQRRAGQVLAQVAAVHVLQHQVRAAVNLAHLMDLDDVRVP
jgi:hypothetical protein